MSRTTKKAIYLLVLAGTLFLVTPARAGGLCGTAPSAEVIEATIAPGQVPDQGPSDPQELEAFMDAFFAAQMSERHIAGAAFVLVKDGRLFFSKGYGCADLEAHTPVDPEQSMFNLGSVGKLFTATAIMQLSEQGLLDVDDPVANYVDDVAIDSGFARPVTIAQLLTHEAGFEERVSGAWVLDPEELLPLGTYLQRDLPSVVLPPGDQISYSNHGYALAGYVVEKVSGMPFEQYVEEKILAPLGMAHTSLRQPLPPALAPHLATGYTYTEDFVPLPQVYGNMTPAGGQQATAADMARFMLAHLHDGRFGQWRILQAKTAQEMRSRHSGGDPRLEGYAYGFAQYYHGDLRAVGKGGDSPGYASLLFLVPEQNLGFFVAFNTNLGLTPVREELIEAFWDHYYPLPLQPILPNPDVDLRRFAGSYRLNRYARTTVDKLLAPLQMIQLRASAGDDGTITLSYPALLGTAPTRWAPVDSLLFRRLDSDAALGFREDEARRITHLQINIAEPAVLEKVPWWETTSVQLALAAFLLLAFLSVLLWPLIFLLRRGRQSPGLEPATAFRARLLAGLLAGLNLLFLVGVGWVVIQAQRLGVTTIPGYLNALLVIPLLTAILAFVLLAQAVQAWRRRWWSLAARLHYSLLAAAGLLFVWFASYWNLLGWQL